MEIKEYQKLAEVTSSLKDSRDDLVSYRNQGRVLMSLLGLAGETGETIDYLKKVIYHSHAMDKEKLIREIGDITWYVSELCSALNIDLSTVLDKNISKLKARYPEGFESIKSIERKSDAVEKYCYLCDSDASYEVTVLDNKLIKNELIMETLEVGTIINLCIFHYKLNSNKIGL
jgi:NTP pyrophosphatase (non-canonical NTP hydrolase)